MSNCKHADVSSGRLLLFLRCCFEAEQCFSVRKSVRKKTKAASHITRWGYKKDKTTKEVDQKQ